MNALPNPPGLATSPHPGEAVDRRPSVFLMINTLETGGSERQFSLLACALGSGDFQIRLGCLKRKGAFLEAVSEIAEFDRGRSFYTFQAQRTSLALGRYLRTHEIVIAHSFDFYANVMLIPAARLAGVPVVIGSHRQLGDLLTSCKYHVQNGLFRLCDRVVCNSRAAADRLLQQGLSERRVVVIPNGLPDEAFAEVGQALPRTPGTLRVGMIARMNDPCKNHSTFLRVAARLSPKFPTLEFLLVGDGPLRPKLEKMALELGLGDRIRFLGERHDLPAVLAAMDISVSLSSSESLSNAILESMAAGVPVVATRVGGNPELVREGETGFLVPPDNEGRFVEALQLLLTEPHLRAEFGQRAKRLARANFGMNRIRDQYQELYATVIAEKLLHQDNAAKQKGR